MDFSESAEDSAFRLAARASLESVIAAVGRNPGPGESAVAHYGRFVTGLHQAGLTGLGWPRQYGGQGASLVEQAIFLEEYDIAGAPNRLNQIGENLAGPAIVEFGTTEQKARYLLPILTGEEIWCQLFSEPDAGSDLAALRTEASREADGWRINGQKVWTSNAEIAAHGLLLARTGGGDRHRGLTYFLLPMDTDGITVRPLRNMLGIAGFNEVFFKDVFLPDRLRMGDVDQGWAVALATLSYERVALATGRVNIQRLMADLLRLARENPDQLDSAMRRRIADLYSRAQIQRVNGIRALVSLEQGNPGPETSIGKLFAAPLVEEIADLACSFHGLDAQIDEETVDPWIRLAYQSRGTSIAGGTTFVQRNIVAERVLGLPR